MTKTSIQGDITTVTTHDEDDLADDKKSFYKGTVVVYKNGVVVEEYELELNSETGEFTKTVTNPDGTVTTTQETAESIGRQTY